MEKEAQNLFDAVEKIMKQHNPGDTKNIKESCDYIRNTFNQDALEIDAYFADLCKKYGYDLADFTTAKIV